MKYWYGCQEVFYGCMSMIAMIIAMIAILQIMGFFERKQLQKWFGPTGEE